MTSLNRAVKLAREYKAIGVNVIEDAYKNGWTHTRLRQELRSKVYDQLPLTPHWLKTQVRDYLDGFEDAVVSTNTSHLYLIDGKLYAISSTPEWAVGENGKQLPNWVKLLQDKWPLGDGGAIYWIYRDKAPALFFKNGEDPDTED